MGKYVSDDILNKAKKFDAHVDGTFAVLGKFGIAAFPFQKTALFFHFCDENEIEVSCNLKKTIVWVSTLEKSIINKIK